MWHSASGGREIDVEESLQEALSAARMWEDSEYGLFDCIEGPAGVVPERDVDRWIEAVHDREQERRRGMNEDLSGKLWWHVAVKHPNGKTSGDAESTFDEDEARRVANELNLPGRVQIYTTVYGAKWNEDTKQVVKDWNE